MNIMNKLKYQGYSIVMQEVPNEVTLAINISGCPYQCKGCHSSYLWEYEGQYLYKDFDNIIEQYHSFISCVCFMGGDQNPKELLKYLNKIKKLNLKTCLYTGNDEIKNIDNQLLEKLDYIKVGSYKEELGGLNCPTTNQKFYNLNTNQQILFY